MHCFPLTAVRNPRFYPITDGGIFFNLTRIFRKTFQNIFLSQEHARNTRFTNRHKLFLLTAGFLLLIAARQVVFRFHFNLGYLYIMLICLSSFWFGIKGGLISALASSIIFLVELFFLTQFASRDIVQHTVFLRFMGYAWAGILTGLIFEKLKKKNRRKSSAPYNPFANNPFLSAINSTVGRIVFITASYVLLEAARFAFPGLSLFLDYSTVILVCVAALWFGIKGGLIGATVTFSLFLLEAYSVPDNGLSRYFLQNLVFSFFFCYLIGSVIGFLSDIEGRLKAKLQDMAYSDELTGCVNYRTAVQVLDKEVSRAVRHRKNLTLIMVDIDNFKKINDRHGHKAGNEILRTFSECSRENLRIEDTVARFGGDEFMIILPETDPDNAIPILEKIKAVFTQKTIGKGIRVSFSAGISCCPRHGNTRDMIFCAADNALFEAKKNGKDQFRMERREYIRFKPAPDIKIHLTDIVSRRELTGFTVENISCRGMLILFPKKPDLNGNFTCIFRAPDPNEEKLVLQCKVVYKNRKKEKYVVGVYFPELPKEKLKKITLQA